MTISVNAGAIRLLNLLVEQAEPLRIGVGRNAQGARIIDAGINHRGSVEAGRQIAAICMADLARVNISTGAFFHDWPWQIEIATSQPLLACLASQYAGWSLSFDEPKFAALGSGPCRALALKEPLFAELDYRDQSTETVIVLETDRPPPEPIIDKIAADCGVAVEQLTVIMTPTGGLAGGVQIVARVVEVALHKAHEMKFDLNAIVDAAGSAPLPPPIADGLQAMGRTNDAVLFGGQVQLWVDASDQAAEELAAGLPSSVSRDYGKPFAKVFSDYDYDFFKIDPMLFSPAKVTVTAVQSGRSFHAGQLDQVLLNRSFDQHVKL